MWCRYLNSRNSYLHNSTDGEEATTVLPTVPTTTTLLLLLIGSPHLLLDTAGVSVYAVSLRDFKLNTHKSVIARRRWWWFWMVLVVGRMIWCTLMAVTFPGSRLARVKAF